MRNPTKYEALSQRRAETWNLNETATDRTVRQASNTLLLRDIMRTVLHRHKNIFLASSRTCQTPYWRSGMSKWEVEKSFLCRENTTNQT